MTEDGIDAIRSGSLVVEASGWISGLWMIPGSPNVRSAAFGTFDEGEGDWVFHCWFPGVPPVVYPAGSGFQVSPRTTIQYWIRYPLPSAQSDGNVRSVLRLFKSNDRPSYRMRTIDAHAAAQRNLDGWTLTSVTPFSQNQRAMFYQRLVNRRENRTLERRHGRSSPQLPSIIALSSGTPMSITLLEGDDVTVIVTVSRLDPNWLTSYRLLSPIPIKAGASFEVSGIDPSFVWLEFMVPR